MSKMVRDKLSPENQAALRKAAAETVDFQRQNERSCAPRLSGPLFDTLRRHAEDYTRLVEAHFDKHLARFG
jgi:hypothetical protein